MGLNGKGNPNFSHGMSNTRTWRAWKEMKRRCYDPSRQNYKFYGARGITVCEEWLVSFVAFFGHMGECPPGLTLDRIDGTKGYEPGNCRWITIQEQQNNRRSNVKVTIEGVTRSVADWARLNGVMPRTAARRIRNGIPPAVAVTHPVRKRTDKRGLKYWDSLLVLEA